RLAERATMPVTHAPGGSPRRARLSGSLARARGRPALAWGRVLARGEPAPPRPVPRRHRERALRVRRSRAARPRCHGDRGALRGRGGALGVFAERAQTSGTLSRSGAIARTRAPDGCALGAPRGADRAGG